MARIFINYRRDDTPGVAGRLFDYLALKYPHRDLFMDVDAMKPGVDFARQLDAQVSECHVLLAVIGPRWLDAHDQAGHRRLDNEKDYVRIELASALKRDIAVIPVLVDGATMPDEEHLSEDLKPLARRHALELRHTRFNSDADAIVHALEDVVPRSRVPWRIVGAGMAVAVAVALAVFWPKLNAKLHPAQPPPLALNVPVQPPRPNAAAPPAQLPSTPPAAAALPPAPRPAPATPAAAVATANSTPLAGLPPGVKPGELLHNVNMPGTVMRMVEISQDDPANCQFVCRTDTQCAAWTYVPPRTAGQSGRCLLKAVIPEQFVNSCCTSGIERAPDPQFREPPPVPATVVGALPGVDLFGSDYRSFSGPQATPEACQAACKAEGVCLAWSYIRAGVIGADPHCFLKAKVPSSVRNTCCISGIERQVAAVTAPAAAPAASPPVASNPLMPNTDLHGASYSNFELSAADAVLCQSACKAESQCMSWTYVHPGAQGPNARCWLKNSVPPATANSCCTSGIERAAAK